MIQWPNKLGGKPKLVNWLNRMLDRCRASELKQVIGGRLIENSDGKTLVIDGAEKSSGVSVGLYRLKSVQADYITCKAWDGTEDGKVTSDASADVYIAKNPEIRETLGQTGTPTETIEGVAYYYTYADISASGSGQNTPPTKLNRYRFAKLVDGTLIETCAVTPEWLLNQPILAIPATTGVFRTPATEEDPVTLQMIHSRHWAVHA